MAQGRLPMRKVKQVVAFSEGSKPAGHHKALRNRAAVGRACAGAVRSLPAPNWPEARKLDEVAREEALCLPPTPEPHTDDVNWAAMTLCGTKPESTSLARASRTRPSPTLHGGRQSTMTKRGDERLGAGCASGLHDPRNRRHPTCTCLPESLSAGAWPATPTTHGIQHRGGSKLGACGLYAWMVPDQAAIRFFWLHGSVSCQSIDK